MTLPLFLSLSHHYLISVGVSGAVALLAAFVRLPSLLLHGIHTYIHPDSLASGDGIRAALRPPSSQAEVKHNPRRPRRPEFDESKAQLLRLRLSHSHLLSRTYFALYRSTFLSSTAALVSILLPSSASVLLALATLSHLVFSLGKVSVDRSASKRSQKQLSLLSAFLGCLAAYLIAFLFSPSVFDFQTLAMAPDLAKSAAALVAGAISGLLFLPTTRAARAFWLGTDQLRWNLAVVSCSAPGKVALYLSLLASIAAPVLWIKPIAAQTGFEEFRVSVMAVSAASQLVVIRFNVQMYLNEAVLCWYQRLHAGRVPDLDYARAKIFLQNHYICLVAIQFLAPPVMVLLLLGVSQMRGELFSGILCFAGLDGCSDLLKEMALFVSWWIMFVSAIGNILSLALYRRGILIVA